MSTNTDKTLITAHSATSPSTHRVATLVEVPKLDTIPIIFIPGIMGSNIKHQTLGEVWKMPNSKVSGITVAKERSKLKPGDLQTQLDHIKTMVDASGDIVVDPRLKLDESTLRKRYWGTVHWDSYGDILTYLQLAFNQVSLDAKPLSPGPGGIAGMHRTRQHTKQQEMIHEWKSLLDQKEISRWHAIESFQATSAAEIEHLKKFNFPVYGMGYNWLQSNEDSALIILKKMQAIKAEYGARFHKFILVTHSMGGLVARRLSQLCGGDIAGIAHTVMPADGAPATYRRIVSGSYEGGGVVNWITSFVLGKDAEHVTAVLANAPGGLELLPNAEYNSRKPWLTLQGHNEKNQLVQTHLPSKNARGEIDPYEQIYKSDKVWWEMVKEELIDPAKLIKNDNPDKQVKEIYKQKIDKVRQFHSIIAKKYHPHSYVSYCHDHKYMSFGALTWTLDYALGGLTAEQIKRLPRVSAKEIEIHNKGIAEEAMKMGLDAKYYIKANVKENNGLRYIRLQSGKLGTFKISSQDAPGDGTVPYQSGRGPLKQNGVKQVFQMTGFDHQGACKDLHVKRSVLYSIVKIIKENNIQPKYR
ncbi:esterase/lipase family protein [Acinetobacter larvae]|uniref:Alpha/beta hydrolase n=1 Tax=Acinetobacter larvae TaxID=1789224 RepID=A0A1B2M352_9GAMM|nr:alpha/beta hydrolase [Acinetobacter larvae]AOA59609.1 alpha/beta hydrolase [Acinetobacter larvae]